MDVLLGPNQFKPNYHNIRGSNGRFIKVDKPPIESKVIQSDYYKEMDWLAHNPVYLGIGGHPNALNENEWIDVAAKFVKKEGVKTYLSKMVKMLRSYRIGA